MRCDHVDCYKRAESSAYLVGLYNSEEKAYHIAVRGMLEGMWEHAVNQEETLDTEPFASCSTWKDCFQQLPEHPFGEPEFTMQASGSYYTVKSCHVMTEAAPPVDVVGLVDEWHQEEMSCE